MTAPIRLEVPSRPEAVSFDPARAAVVVVDLQNGYASPGGYRDLMGRDIGPAPRVIENTNRILGPARNAGMTIVFLQNGWDPELGEGGGENSPNWHKSNPLKLMRARPELRGKILTRGSWDYDLVDAIRPEPDDLIVAKPRYSGFAGTSLDALLRERDIRWLVFTGIATNVCVESTLREAYFREYFCLLVEDATQHSGPDFIQQATIHNVETFFGWVTTTEELSAALTRAL